VAYDGTFAGFLTVLHRCTSQGEGSTLEVVEINRQKRFLGELFVSTMVVNTDQEKALEFAARFGKARSLQQLRLLYHGFLSELPGIEMELLRFVYGEPVSQDANGVAHDERENYFSALFNVENAERRVLQEVHRFLGLLRFRSTSEGGFIAEFEPDCNLMPLLAPCFAERMPGERWCIVDRKRSSAVIYADGRLHFRTYLRSERSQLFPDSASPGGDDRFAALWRDYVHHIAVHERTNLLLQRQFLPKKHRRYLPEVDP
jgi:probable DNA metabolism protein